MYDLYKKMEGSFWTSNEIDLAKDMNDWEKLSENERFFIKNIIGFFAGSDGIIMENLAARFMKEIQIPEARAFYSYQIFNESVHSETYSLLIDTYIKDETEKDTLFNALTRFPCITKKGNWALKWMNPENSFSKRIVAFACVEGIFFSGAFCSIYWLKKRGLMPGLTFSNELISRDEALHTEFAVYLYNKLEKKLTKKRIHEIIHDAVEIEKEFITESLPCRLIGMNSDLMNQYIEFVANRLSLQLGGDQIYNSVNPFDFMEMISLEQKTNFFESRVSEYSLAEKTGKYDAFSLDNILF
jgi:ribonucleoside-diphosphate reductase beta chain